MEKQEVTMVCTGGMFVCGVLKDGNKLIGPRMFQVMPIDETDPEKGVNYMMTPPPGVPPFITIGAEGFRYKVPEDQRVILDLYHRVTHPKQISVVPPAAGIKVN